MREIKTLSDITINDWLFIQSLQGDDNYIKKEIIKYFNLNKLSISETDTFLLNLDNVIKNIPSEIPLTLRFKYEGVEYGFIPNLNNITTAEWLDIDGLSDNVVEMMSILYRPIVKKGKWFWRDKYQIEEYKESHNRFGELPVDILLGAIFFLISLRETLSEILNIYTLQMQVKAIKSSEITLQQKQHFLNNITGIIYSTSQQMKVT